jgi:DNA-binding transcriptional LysR family regulator
VLHVVQRVVPRHLLDRTVLKAALALVRATDWVACVHERHTGALYAGMHSFALPVPIALFTVSLLWHPRLDGDPAHRWLRGCVRGVCAEQRPAE